MGKYPQAVDQGQLIYPSKPLFSRIKYDILYHERLHNSVEWRHKLRDYSRVFYSFVALNDIKNIKSYKYGKSVSTTYIFWCGHEHDKLKNRWRVFCARSQRHLDDYFSIKTLWWWYELTDFSEDFLFGGLLPCEPNIWSKKVYKFLGALECFNALVMLCLLRSSFTVGIVHSTWCTWYCEHCFVSISIDVTHYLSSIFIL